VSRLLLDTGIFIEAERTRGTIGHAIGDEDDVAIAAITAAELLVGVERAVASRRDRRASFVEDVLANVPVEDYGVDIARAHARLLAYTSAAGTPRGAHDLIIAATAVATDREVVTHDVKAAFDTLPDVRCRVIPRP
jgi:tRNA(fMet)-specific endonuclease VapC